MPENADKSRKKPKEIHGNQAKIAPGQAPVSQYEASTVTSYEKRGEAPPAMRDSHVASAQHFVQENKK